MKCKATHEVFIHPSLVLNNMLMFYSFNIGRGGGRGGGAAERWNEVVLGTMPDNFAGLFLLVDFKVHKAVSMIRCVGCLAVTVSCISQCIGLSLVSGRDLVSKCFYKYLIVYSY